MRGEVNLQITTVINQREGSRHEGGGGRGRGGGEGGGYIE